MPSIWSSEPELLVVARADNAGAKPANDLGRVNEFDRVRGRPRPASSRFVPNRDDEGNDDSLSEDERNDEDDGPGMSVSRQR